MTAHKAPMKPLLQFVEEIDNAIHLDPSDEKVAVIIKENFSSNLSVFEDETILSFATFKAFNTSFRKDFLALEILDSKAVTFKADPTGLVGVVGFAQTFLLENKTTGQLSTGDTVEIFEVDFAPEHGKGEGRIRMITKAFAAIGEMTLIASKIVGRTSKARGLPKKTAGQSKSTPRTRPTGPTGITKRSSASRVRK